MSDGSLRGPARNRRFCEGWLEHRAHRASDYRYEKLYAVLEDNVLYIFESDRPSEETQVGNLTLDSNAEFTMLKGGNQNKGFKFELYTGKRLNRFKTKKSTEREQWRAYIIGISKGFVPNDLDLLPSDIEVIKRNVTRFHGGDVCDYDPRRSSIASRKSNQSKVDSGVVSLGGGSRISGNSSGDESRSSASGTMTHGGPTMVHKFYNDHNRDQSPPSWFIPHCSREMAERLLENAFMNNYGNTLLRESTSHLSNGSYVISKLIANTRDGSVEFDHFEVIRTARGYKVNVQNPHDPMKCLADVMDYFVRTSGGSTHPLIVNDLKLLGQETPGYATQIHPGQSADPWVWPPPESRDEPLPGGSLRNYETPDSAPPQRSHARSLDGSQTVTAGILRRNDRPLPSPSSDRKSVGWSTVIKTPPAVQSKTYSGPRSKPDPVPSMAELALRSKEAGQIEEMDNMLSGFERDTLYINSPTNSNERTTCQPPPPPPPVPHTLQRPRSYIDMNTQQESREPELDALPVAPPAPRDPIVPSPASTTNPKNSLSKSSPYASKGLSSAATDFPPSPASSVQLRHSVSTKSSGRENAQNRPHVTKSFSDNQLRSVNKIKSLDSPNNLPTWNSPKQASNVLNQTRQPEMTKVGGANSEESQKGVDDTNPGGVSTLRSRFEGGRNSASSVPSKPGHSRSSLPVRWSLSSAVNETIDELDNLYEYLSEDDQNHKETNNGSQSTNTTYKKHIDIRSSQSMLDTKSNPHSLLAVGRSQSLNLTSQTTTPEVTYIRRQQQPEAEEYLYDDTAVSREQSGLNADFKKKLEGMIGGNTVGPATGKGAKPAVPKVRPTSDAAEDHIYQELPEEIPPDGVFYANERYNR